VRLVHSSTSGAYATLRKLRGQIARRASPGMHLRRGQSWLTALGVRSLVWRVYRPASRSEVTRGTATRVASLPPPGPSMNEATQPTKLLPRRNTEPVLRHLALVTARDAHPRSGMLGDLAHPLPTKCVKAIATETMRWPCDKSLLYCLVEHY